MSITQVPPAEYYTQEETVYPLPPPTIEAEPSQAEHIPALSQSLPRTSTYEGSTFPSLSDPLLLGFMVFGVVVCVVSVFGLVVLAKRK